MRSYYFIWHSASVCEKAPIFKLTTGRPRWTLPTSCCSWTLWWTCVSCQPGKGPSCRLQRKAGTSPTSATSCRLPQWLQAGRWKAEIQWINGCSHVTFDALLLSGRSCYQVLWAKSIRIPLFWTLVRRNKVHKLKKLNLTCGSFYKR